MYTSSSMKQASDYTTKSDDCTDILNYKILVQVNCLNHNFFRHSNHVLSYMFNIALNLLPILPILKLHYNFNYPIQLGPVRIVR